MNDRPLIGPAADWITYYIDENCGHLVVTGIYEDELEALRYGNTHREHVTLFAYGADVQNFDLDAASQ